MKTYYIWTGPCAGKTYMANVLNNFLKWKAKHDEVEPLFMERSMTSDRFAGTVDFYGTVDGKKTILDFKSSKAIYSSMFLQLAAYCIMLEEHGYEVEQVAIITVNDKPSKERFIERERLENYIRVYKTLVELFHGWFDLNIEDGWGSIIEN